MPGSASSRSRADAGTNSPRLPETILAAFRNFLSQLGVSRTMTRADLPRGLADICIAQYRG